MSELETLKAAMTEDAKRVCSSPGSTHWPGCPCYVLRVIAELEADKQRLDKLDRYNKRDPGGFNVYGFCKTVRESIDKMPDILKIEAEHGG